MDIIPRAAMALLISVRNCREMQSQRTCTHYRPFIDLLAWATVQLAEAAMIYEAEIASPTSCPTIPGDKLGELCADLVI